MERLGEEFVSIIFTVCIFQKKIGEVIRQNLRVQIRIPVTTSGFFVIYGSDIFFGKVLSWDIRFMQLLKVFDQPRIYYRPENGRFGPL